MTTVTNSVGSTSILTDAAPSMAPSPSNGAKTASRPASPAVGKPPVAPVVGNGSSQVTGGIAAPFRPASEKGSSPCSTPPMRRNILYRIFHLDSDAEFFANSRRPGSAGEADSEASEDDSHHGSLDRVFGRHNKSAESSRKGTPGLPRRGITVHGCTPGSSASDDGSSSDADGHHAPIAPVPKRTPSRSNLADWFHLPRDANHGSSDDGSGSDPDRPGVPKRSASRSSMLSEWLHVGRKNKSESAPTSPCITPEKGVVPKEEALLASTKDVDIESRIGQSHNLFKDIIMHAKNKKQHAGAGKAAEAYPHLVAGASGAVVAEKPTAVPMTRSLSENSLAKYGQKHEVLGRGANAVVRLCCPANGGSKKLAVKEFRKRRKNETQKEYIKKLIAEFCISSTLHHENVVSTVDLIQDEKHHWCVVMEYCAGGDLFGRIHCGTLKESGEVNCYLKQLVQGVQYLHSMGVAHRDLKPENLLLDKAGKILKITDFGVSEVFRNPFCTLARKAKGLCGSGPYIAPEEFESGEYDSEKVDVWSVGIIYYVMVYNSIPWKAATMSDARYKHFVEHKGQFWPFDRMQAGPRRLMYRILDPNPATRITIKEIEEDEWFKSLSVCHEDTTSEMAGHQHVGNPKPFK